MRSTHLLVVVAVTSILTSEGRSQELRAVALERDTKQPVVDARVSLLSRRRAELDTARTAADGSFSVRAKEGGKFFLSVRRFGYPAEETDAIFLNAGETRIDTVYVAPARTLQKVETVIDREIFRIFGVTIASLSDRAVILPEDVESVRASSRTASDVVMQKGPTYVRVEGAGTGRVCYQIHGGGCALLYLNGQPIPSSTDIPVHDLEAVAVLTPTDAQMLLGRNNGVVMLFSRGMLRTQGR
ncbi:MAG: carboxypeptidase-like regulatory domain-containing protein [Gemmatimonadaceae bacterium]